MLRNVFVSVFFDVEYPVKTDSMLDIALLRSSHYSLKRLLAGVTDSHLFIFCGTTTLDQATEIVSKYQFAEFNVTTIAEPDGGECASEPLEYGESIDYLVERWLKDRHPAAITHLNAAAEARLDVWWSGIEAVDNGFDFADDFATTLPGSHKSKATTWLAILNEILPESCDNVHEEQKFLLATASLCKWLHGFEEECGNGYDDFDYGAVISALPFEEFYLGYLLGQYRSFSAFNEVMEESESESIHDLKTFALQQTIEDEGLDIRSTLLDFYGGGTGLFWALYTAIWQNFRRPSSEQCNERLNSLSWDDLAELSDSWEYVVGGNKP